MFRTDGLARRALPLGLATLLLLAATAPAASASGVQAGVQMDKVQEARNLGATTTLGSFWIGPWTASYWPSLDNALRTAKSTGATPVLYWYYWGDSISPSCVDHGCAGRSRQQWIDMTRTIADKIRHEMGGQTVYVVLENEFNKGGITDSWYAGTFDAHLEARAKELKAVPGVKIVLGFGSWGEASWGKFPRAAAQSDYIGFQIMRAQTRDSESSYRGAADAVAHYTGHIARTFQKPSFLYDLALSSYYDAHWERVQAETLSAVLDQVVQSGSTGLQAVVYRALRDHYMDPKNYYGWAESHWGLLKGDGREKPAWHVWKTKTAAAATAPAPAPEPAPSTGAPQVAFAPYDGNEWWVQTKLSGADAARVTKVEAKDANSPWTTLSLRSWGAWAGSFRVESGNAVTYRATLADGRVAESCAFGHPSGGCTTAAPAPAPADASLSFTSKGGNEWWVQVALGGADAASVARVESRDDGGQWVQLTKRSWGDYAGSYRVEPGNRVYYRATLHDGRTVESCAFAHPSTSTCASSPASAPAYAATFSNPRGNAWWVEVDVKASSLAGVDARVNGGAWTALDRTAWGSYAKSVQAPSGSAVEFRARSTDGGSALSQSYAWPPR